MAKVKLGSVCTIVSGSTPKSSCPEYWGGSIKWVTPAEISDETHYIEDTERHITEEGMRSCHLRMMPLGTVLLSSRAPIGKTAITKSPMCCNQGFKNLICSGSISNEYLYHFLSAKTDELKSIGRGATFKEISKKQVESITIDLPALNEQDRRTTVLNQIESLLKRSHDSKNRIDDLVKSRFIEMFGEEHRLVELSEVCETFNGDRSSNYPSANERIKAGIPFVNAGNLTNGAISFNNMEYVSGEKYRQLSGGKIQTGDLLYCLRGSLGKCALADFDKGTIASSLMIIRCNQERIQPKYLYETMVSPFVERQMASANNGSSQPNLSAKSVQQFKIPLPPLALQQEFADFVSQVDKLRFAAQQQIDKLELLKKSLLQEYFN